MTNRKQAHVLLNEILNKGTSQETLLDWVLSNYLEGSQAVEALELFKMEMFDDVFDEDVVEEEEEDHYNDVFYDKEKDVELDD